MIIIKNNIIPFGYYSTINLFSIIFTKKDKLSEKLINHERIHTRQMIELFIVSAILILFLCFIFNLNYLFILLSAFTYYIWYAIEYILVRFFHIKQNSAYHDIAFEEEAYNFDDDLDYCKNRKYFAWLKYLKIKSYT